MNLSKSSITKYIFHLTLVFSTIFLISYTENNVTAQKKTAASSISKAAPKIDIHAAVVAGNIEAVIIA